MKAPKCRTCGAEEWRHTCGPAVKQITTKTKQSSKPVAKRG